MHFRVGAAHHQSPLAMWRNSVAQTIWATKWCIFSVWSSFSNEKILNRIYNRSKRCDNNFLGWSRCLRLFNSLPESIGTWLILRSSTSTKASFATSTSRWTFVSSPLVTLNAFRSSRYGRNRTRFVNVPPEYDVNSSNTTLLHAALVAGLYPKILSIDRSTSINHSTGVLRTPSNQIATFHPSSVNFNKKLADIDANYMVYFTLMYVIRLFLVRHSRNRLYQAFQEAICMGDGPCGRRVVNSLMWRIRFQGRIRELWICLLDISSTSSFPITLLLTGKSASKSRQRPMSLWNCYGTIYHHCCPIRCVARSWRNHKSVGMTWQYRS